MSDTLLINKSDIPFKFLENLKHKFCCIFCFIQWYFLTGLNGLYCLDTQCNVSLPYLFNASEKYLLIFTFL